MTNSEPILTPRLELLAMNLAFVEAVLELRRPDAEAALGVRLTPFWPVGDERWLEIRRDQMRADPAVSEWCTRAVVLLDRTLIGRMGFHGAPDAAGEAEIGYELDAPYRKLGYATEAVGALLEWGFARPSLKLAVACMKPRNVESVALAARLGFTFTRTVTDERHGERLRYERTR